jgi:hypothetical protein
MMQPRQGRPIVAFAAAAVPVGGLDDRLPAGTPPPAPPNGTPQEPQWRLIVDERWEELAPGVPASVLDEPVPRNALLFLHLNFRSLRRREEAIGDIEEIYQTEVLPRFGPGWRAQLALWVEVFSSAAVPIKRLWKRLNKFVTLLLGAGILALIHRWWLGH